VSLTGHPHFGVGLSLEIWNSSPNLSRTYQPIIIRILIQMEELQRYKTCADMVTYTSEGN
jgi:hypothetical protein